MRTLDAPPSLAALRYRYGVGLACGSRWRAQVWGEHAHLQPHREERVLANLYGWLCEQYEPVTTSEVAAFGGVTRKTAGRHLRALVARDLAQRNGYRRGRAHGREALWVALDPPEAA